MTLSFKTEPLQNKYIGLRNAEDIIQNLKKKKKIKANYLTHLAFILMHDIKESV